MIVAGSPAKVPDCVVPGQSVGSPAVTRASKAESHSLSVVPAGIAIEFMTRNELKSLGAAASSPGISPPGVNWESESQEPSYSLTIQPAGTSMRYPCRVDSKTSAAGDADAEGDAVDAGMEGTGDVVTNGAEAMGTDDAVVVTLAPEQAAMTKASIESASRRT